MRMEHVSEGTSLEGESIQGGLEKMSMKQRDDASVIEISSSTHGHVFSPNSPH